MVARDGGDNPKGLKKLVEVEPILTFENIKPVSVTKTPKGAYLYDFGINFTGVCRLKIKGERGQEIRLSHGEILNNGDLDMTTLGFNDFGGRELFCVGRRHGYQKKSREQLWAGHDCCR